MKNQKIKSNNKKNIMKVAVLTLLMVLVLSSIALASADPIDKASDYAMQRIGTVFLVIVAFGITKNFAKNATTKLFGFIVIAIAGGMLVYKPEFIQKGADWVYSIFF